MSLNQTHIECLVIRRSENTNSFGLRGIWVLCLHSRDVFSFAANHLDAERYQRGAIVRVPFFVDVKAHTKAVAHELSHHEWTVSQALIQEFVTDFGLSDTYNDYFKARAIEAETVITRADYMTAGGYDAHQAHHAYYRQAVTRAIIDRVVLRIGGDKILKSKDKYFNDIRLPVPLGGHSTDAWCNCVTIDEACDFNTLTKVFNTATRGCSDSDRVCIAKAAAREWLNEQNK